MPLLETVPFVRDVTHVENDVQHDTDVRGDDILARTLLCERYVLIHDANTHPCAEWLDLDCRVSLRDEHERCENDDADG